MHSEFYILIIKKLDKTQLASVKKLISEKNKLLIVTHNNPDGDALGSSMALYNYLINTNKDVSVITPNHFPENLAWLKGADKVCIYNQNVEKAKSIIEQAEIIFCLDFNALHRIDKMEESIKNAAAQKVLIDHHLQPQLENFNYAFSKIDISSTSELVYNFITGIDGQKAINKEIAEAIYVGILTDTGSFSYSCNYEETFAISAHLLSIGIDAEAIHRKVYDTFSESRLRLLGYCLSKKLVVIDELSTAYISLTREELNYFNYQVGDTEGLVNYALSIEHIKLAALFTEREGLVRISFRSKGDIDVNEFARKHFNGGGHHNASGATSRISLKESIAKFNASIKEYPELFVVFDEDDE